MAHYTLKLYDKFNFEYEQLREEFDSYYAATIKAICYSKKRWCSYAILEDDNMERLGWYEKGHNLDRD